MKRKLTKNLFENVSAFLLGEPGTMGVCGELEVLTGEGESFEIDFLVDEEPFCTYSELKENFPALNDCCWNGPMEGENKTKVPEGYRHIYLGCGNHLCVKEELYEKTLHAVEGMEDWEIAFRWSEIVREVTEKKRCERKGKHDA